MIFSNFSKLLESMAHLMSPSVSSSCSVDDFTFIKSTLLSRGASLWKSNRKFSSSGRIILASWKRVQRVEIWAKRVFPFRSWHHFRVIKQTQEFTSLSFNQVSFFCWKGLFFFGGEKRRLKHYFYLLRHCFISIALKW